MLQTLFDMFKGLGSIFYKEIIQISRDPLTLVLMLVIPMIQLTVFGYAINTDVRNIKTAVYDLDHRRESREITDLFAGGSAAFLLFGGALSALWFRRVP